MNLNSVSGRPMVVCPVCEQTVPARGLTNHIAFNHSGYRKVPVVRSASEAYNAVKESLKNYTKADSSYDFPAKYQAAVELAESAKALLRFQLKVTRETIAPATSVAAGA